MQSRRTFLRAAGVGIAGLGLSVHNAACAASTGRPNIVLIMSDDMGISDIGCYGSEIDTPVLDGLAADGLRFTQFYNTARCCPTRASLLTGLYPHQAGVGHMMHDRGVDGYPMRMGEGVMAGGPDTYIGYGKAWANVSNTPFREYKHWVHEGGIATPLIAHWPSGIKARGELRHTPSHLVDIMTTCVDVAGATYPDEHERSKIKPMEGVSLTPVFENKPVKREALYWEHEGNCAIRIGKWKLVGKGVLGPEGPRVDRWELYDIDADRSELKNLAQEHPERVKKMSAMYLDYARRTDVLPFGSKQKK